MKKISEGKFEVFTSKEDAIDKFMQLQGYCVDQINGGEDSIEFICLKNGKMVIGDIPKRRYAMENATKLYAKVIEEDGKTYVSYYTSFSKFDFVYDLLFIIFALLVLVGVTIFKGIFAIETKEKIHLPVLYALCLVGGVFRFISKIKEKKNSPKDSEIMIKELEKRVNAVNYWDK